MDFNSREYKKITFQIGAMAITASIGLESLVPYFAAERHECGVGMAPTYCIRPGLEPWNHHTTERDFVNDPPAASYGYIASGAVNSMTPNSFTPRSTFLLAGDGNDIDITT